jgi:aminoglycoside phosphotransferase (APT) family kinase protein
MKLHDGEVDIDADLVRRLLTDQMPHLAGRTVTPIVSTGTVNAIYRLGSDLYARLPRVDWLAADLDKEWRLLPHLRPYLTLEVPEPVAQGSPTPDYPFRWSVYRWIEGAPYTDDAVTDEGQAARDLGGFVRELRAVPLDADAPRAGRRPLPELTAETRAALESARDVIDADAALVAWDDALGAPAWDGSPTWIHADLLRPNLLVRDGRLVAVIDFGGAGVGDPATDVIAAWSVFGPTGRAAYRAELDVDDGTWARARGIALHQAALIIPYYAETNRAFVALARRTVEQVVDDVAS